ncbi:hypothetical protein GOP47_0002714 [Adiantum capillus-veneris]|uniref:Uncharacterized protein n=1 Tax=Adiantum capillus-veneris TaxID=13818 RepID=A0A9D4VC46_ADICA|nr:hypothetical protein GOP47_0002714 [Adiantum capillus-veneris]
MRKVLWSPEEDERLVRCISKPESFRLDRCGKSCRRRWLNHLRPDLKRGKFSLDEISLVLQLQKDMGNRWSDIARHLNGRTDNDIKNLWNTQLKKKRLAQQVDTSSSSSTVPSIVNGDFEALTTAHATSHEAKTIVCIDNNLMYGALDVKSCDLDNADMGDILLITSSGNDVNALKYCRNSASSCESRTTSEPRPSYQEHITVQCGKPNYHESFELHKNSRHLVLGSSHEQTNYWLFNSSVRGLDDVYGAESEAAYDGVSLMPTSSCSTTNNIMNCTMRWGMTPLPDQQPSHFHAITSLLEGNHPNFVGSTVTSRPILSECLFRSEDHISTFNSNITAKIMIDGDKQECNYSPNLFPTIHSTLSTHHSVHLPAPSLPSSPRSSLADSIDVPNPSIQRHLNCSPRSSTGSRSQAIEAREKHKTINNAFNVAHFSIPMDGGLVPSSDTHESEDPMVSHILGQNAYNANSVNRPNDEPPRWVETIENESAPLWDHVMDSEPLWVNYMEEWDDTLTFLD